MNLSQRIILIAGAIALLVVFFTTPRYVTFMGQRITYRKSARLEGESAADYKERIRKTPFSMESMAPSRDLREASIRIGIVIAITALAYFAARKRKAKEYNIDDT